MGRASSWRWRRDLSALHRHTAEARPAPVVRVVPVADMVALEGSAVVAADRAATEDRAARGAREAVDVAVLRAAASLVIFPVSFPF